MNTLKIAFLSALCAGMLAGAAPAEAASKGFVKQAGDFMIRGRATSFIPNEDQTTSVGGEVEISNSLIPEVDLNYFVTDHIALELVLGTTPHDLNLKNSTAGDADLGDVWLLPPTLMLQYHFNPMGDMEIQPYVGAGINYTLFYGEDFVSPVTRVDYDNSIGGALQVGADIPIDQNWAFNVDLKYVWVDSEDTEIDITGVGTATADVTIDPWVASVGIGYKF